MPLRQRNSLLLAGGHVPAYSQSALVEAPMAAVSDAINRIIDAHDTFPAVVVDHHWDLVAGNRAVGILPEGVAPFLLEPPVNVLRLEVTPDAQLGALLEELRTYPSGGEWHEDELSSLLVPLRIRAGDTELAMFSTTTVFGTPRDVTLAEIAIESFYPSDPATAEFSRSVGWIYRDFLPNLSFHGTSADSI
ncbi:hypothetical protein [Rhodococcus sp. IEGM 1379]|uniref:MmyB family transcriptional regulator n=1 Tax=Rhodococcus sp. IEGM 1379 TaxID=3047086 RepID=UPI0024B861D0|nr:hypothetical protein [Rhodococcus sp. IEGM 1379]MDI9914418.1 hypothetical protein [Rhodococcus sp. IEGM 1379]